MGNIGSLYAYIGADTKGLAVASKNVSSFVSKTTSQMKAVGVAVTSVGAAFAAIGATQVFSYVIKSGMEYEKTMAVVKGVTRSTAKQFEDLKSITLELGRTTEWTATQAAEGLKFLSMAGFEVNDSMKALPAVLDLATAGNIDLGRAADIATNAMTAMGIAVEDLGKVNDTFVATITRTNTDMEMMAESFKYAAPVAKAFGYSIDEVATMIGLLGNAGVQGSMAGTQLAFAMQKAAMYSKEVGMEDAKLIDILRKLNKEQASQLDYMEIFDMRGGRAALILKDQTEAYTELGKKVKNANGESQQLATTMRDTLSNSFALLKSALDGISQRLYDEIFRDDLKQTIDSLTTAITAMGDAIYYLAKGAKYLKDNSQMVKTFALLKESFKGWKEIELYTKAIMMAKAGLVDMEEVLSSNHEQIVLLVNSMEKWVETGGKFRGTIDKSKIKKQTVEPTIFTDAYLKALKELEATQEEFEFKSRQLTRDTYEQKRQEIYKWVEETEKALKKQGVTISDEMKQQITNAGLAQLNYEYEKEQLRQKNLDEKFTQDKLQAYRTMYSDMGKLSKRYYDIEKKLIDAQAKEYLKATKDIQAVDAWKKDQYRKLLKQQLVDTEGFVGGVKSAIMELEDYWENYNQVIGQVGKDTFEDIYQAFNDSVFNGLQGKFDELEDIWGNVWDNMKQRMLKIVADMITQMAMKKFVIPITTQFQGTLGGLGGIGTFLTSAMGYAALGQAIGGNNATTIGAGLGGAIGSSIPGTSAGIASGAGAGTMAGAMAGPFFALVGGILGNAFASKDAPSTYSLSGNVANWSSSFDLESITSKGFQAFGEIAAGTFKEAFALVRDETLNQFNLGIDSLLLNYSSEVSEQIKNAWAGVSKDYYLEVSGYTDDIEKHAAEFSEAYYTELNNMFNEILQLPDIQGMLFIEEMQSIIDQNTLSDWELQLKEINSWYKKQINLLKSYNLSSAQSNEALTSLNNAYQAQIDNLKSTVMDTEDSLNTFANTLEEFTNFINSTNEFIDSMTLSSQFAPALSYAQVQNKFNEMYNKVLTGDMDALNSLFGFTQQTYLPFMQSYNVGGYQDLFNSLFGVGGLFTTMEEQVGNVLGGQYGMDYGSLLESMNTTMDVGTQNIVDSINAQTIALISTLTSNTTLDTIGTNSNLSSVNNITSQLSNVDLSSLYAAFASTAGNNTGQTVKVNIDSQTLLDIIIKAGGTDEQFQNFIQGMNG